MNETLNQIRTQSVVLVDMFAAAFLFIFVAFLMLYTMFLLSIDQIENKTSGGWKAFSAQPFTTQEVTEGLERHAVDWVDQAFVEFHADRIVTYARTYREPDVFDMSNGADPENYMRAFLRTVRRNYERLGPTSMSLDGYGWPDRPHVNMYVLDSRHYYQGRDLIQENDFSWAEFAVPSLENGAAGASGDGDETGAGDGSITAEDYTEDWQDILSGLNQVRNRTVDPQAQAESVTSLSVVPMDEREITLRMLQVEEDLQPVIDRLLPLLWLLVIVPLAAETHPHVRQLLARIRLRRALAQRNA